ncbi:MAG: flavin reductase family protein [Rhodanobacteraceae bacterium]
MLDCMDMYREPETRVVEPKILYFGTPVVLVTTRNPDGSANITPMSSAWALADRVTIGLAGGGQGLDNLLRERECVLNLAGEAMRAGVERLAPTTGRDPVPAFKRTGGYRHVSDKFALAGWHAEPALVVGAPRIAEAPLQLEARVLHADQRDVPAWTNDAGGYVSVELQIVKVHAHVDVVVAGTQHIDPCRYRPLFYVFRHYYGVGERLGRTFKAEV